MAAPAMGVVRASGKGPDWLIKEFQSAWEILANLTADVSDARAALQDARAVTAVDLADARDRYQSDLTLLLIEPVVRYLYLKPIRRSLEALEECDQNISPVSARARAPIDTSFQALLARTAISLCEPSRIRCGGDRAAEWKDWEDRRAQRKQRAVRLLRDYENWASHAEQPDAKTVQDLGRRKRLETWWRQQRAVDGLLDTEIVLTSLGLEWFGAAESLLSSLWHDRQQIVGIAQRVVDWIEGGEHRSSVPYDAPAVATPDQRLRAILLQLEESAKQLPEQSEVVRPGPPARWRLIKPRSAFLNTFHLYCRSSVRNAVFEYWGSTAALAREASRAGEMIDRATQKAADSSVRSSALQNAAALLHERLHAVTQENEIEPSLVQAFLQWNPERAAALEGAQFGWIALIRRPRGRRLARTKLQASPRVIMHAAERAGFWAADHWRRTIEALGGRSERRQKSVLRRSQVLRAPQERGEPPDGPPR